MAALAALPPARYCPAQEQYEGADWPNATAGTTVQGTCIEQNGFTGIAVRTCSSAAVWGPITTPCKPIVNPCPPINGYQGRTNWPSTKAGNTATGTCAVGYTTQPAGSPQRQCYDNGTWSGEVTNDCVVSMFRWPWPQRPHRARSLG